MKPKEELIGSIYSEHTTLEFKTLSDKDGVFNLQLNTFCDNTSGCSLSSSFSIYTGDDDYKEKLYDLFTKLANKFKQ